MVRVRTTVRIGAIEGPIGSDVGSRMLAMVKKWRLGQGREADPVSQLDKPRAMAASHLEDESR